MSGTAIGVTCYSAMFSTEVRSACRATQSPRMALSPYALSRTDMTYGAGCAMRCPASIVLISDFRYPPMRCLVLIWRMLLQAHACAMRFAVLSYRKVLPACYAKFGTDLRYAATRALMAARVITAEERMLVCYAMSGTDLAYAAIYQLVRTQLMVLATYALSPYVRTMRCAVLISALAAYARATRCPVLRQRRGRCRVLSYQPMLSSYTITLRYQPMLPAHACAMGSPGSVSSAEMEASEDYHRLTGTAPSYSYYVPMFTASLVPHPPTRTRCPVLDAQYEMPGTGTY
eukprot:3940760-Rhodomonas_salina.2